MHPRLRQAKEKAAEVLQMSARARTKGIQLQQVDYAGDLSKKLVEWAHWAEGKYSELQKATTDRQIHELFADIQKKEPWVLEAEAGF